MSVAGSADVTQSERSRSQFRCCRMDYGLSRASMCVRMRVIVLREEYKASRKQTMWLRGVRTTGA